jgi:hypothetical protein
MKKILRNWSLIGVAGICSVLATGCVSSKLRQDARATVTQFAEKSKGREDNYIAALTTLIRQQLAADQARRVEAIHRKKAEAKNRILMAYETEQATSFETASVRLKGHLNPLTSKYYEALEKERVRAQQTGSRENEYLAGAQLAATMAEGMKQEGDLHETIRTKLATYRGEALQAIDSIPIPPELTTPVSDDKIKEILEAAIANSKEYKKAVDAAEKALADFISKTDPKAIANQFFKALAGDQIAQLVSGKLSSLLDKGEKETNGLLDKLTNAAEAKIAAMTGAQIPSKPVTK